MITCLIVILFLQYTNAQAPQDAQPFGRDQIHPTWLSNQDRIPVPQTSLIAVYPKPPKLYEQAKPPDQLEEKVELDSSPKRHTQYLINSPFSNNKKTTKNSIPKTTANSLGHWASQQSVPFEPVIKPKSDLVRPPPPKTWGQWGQLWGKRATKGRRTKINSNQIKSSKPQKARNSRWDGWSETLAKRRERWNTQNRDKTPFKRVMDRFEDSLSSLRDRYGNSQSTSVSSPQVESTHPPLTLEVARTTWKIEEIGTSTAGKPVPLQPPPKPLPYASHAPPHQHLKPFPTAPLITPKTLPYPIKDGPSNTLQLHVIESSAVAEGNSDIDMVDRTLFRLPLVNRTRFTHIYSHSEEDVPPIPSQEFNHFSQYQEITPRTNPRLTSRTYPEITPRIRLVEKPKEKSESNEFKYRWNMEIDEEVSNELYQLTTPQVSQTSPFQKHKATTELQQTKTCKRENWEPCLSEKVADSKFESCCKDKQLPTGCWPACRYGIGRVELEKIFLWDKTCPGSYVYDYILCASGELNAIECCRDKSTYVDPKVAKSCEPYCNPKDGLPEFQLGHVKCLEKIDLAFQCFWAVQPSQ